MSTFSGVEISKRALSAQSQSLNTVGHNISNINNKWYSKQRVELATLEPLHIPGLRPEIPGQIGQGVDKTAIVRQRDYQIDVQIISEGHKEEFWNTRSQYMSKLESIYNEVGDSSLRSMLDRYWESWQEVSLYPEQNASRIVLLERAETLTAAVQDRFGQLQQTRNMLDEEVVYTSNLINQYTQDIAVLNHKIYESQAMGDHPNDWLDRRDSLVEDLSKLVNITIDKSDPNEYLIHTNGKVLVQGDYARSFETIRNATDVNTHTVVWSDTGETVDYSGGKLSSLVQLRDGDVRGEIQNLNTFAITLSDGTNSLHRVGDSLTGESGRDFFVETPVTTNPQGNYDSTEDGVFDQTRLFRLTGTNSLKLNETIGFSGAMTLPGRTDAENVIVNYTANDTVKNVIDRINGSGAEVVAGLDVNQKLSVHATTSVNPEYPDFVLRSLEDSGEFLAGYSGILTAPGLGGAYNWQQADMVDGIATASYSVAPFLHPAAYISVNPLLKDQPSQIAAGVRAQDGIVDVGDGSIALAIANLRTESVGFGQEKSFDDYFADSIASVASRGQDAAVRSDTYSLIMNDLRRARSAISGVSLDEELQDMVKFQTAYGAAARFLTQLNQIYDTLLGIMG